MLFFQHEVHFLGHIISQHGVSPDVKDSESDNLASAHLSKGDIAISWDHWVPPQILAHIAKPRHQLTVEVCMDQ